MKRFSSLLGLVAAAALAGCSGSDDEKQPPPAAFTIAFRAVVGTQPFACGTTYAGVGTTGASWSPLDFRLYVHDVRLVRSDGAEVPFAMDQVAGWQDQGVALLDFEDGSAGCATLGDAAVRTTVTGTAPGGRYTGVRFKVGVPFARNHLDAATAAAPLDRTALFWSWTSGYKYARIDGRNSSAATPSTFNVHLGATGCTAVDPADPSKGVTGCSAPNVPEIALTGFDPATDQVVLDAGALLAGVNLDADGGGPPGCMSGPNDPECGPIFAKLGLAWGTSPAGAQAVFAKAGALTSVQVAFKGVVGAAPFACGTTYPGLGTSSATYSPMDFRFYVHDVRLLRADGSEAPVALDEVAGWQHAGVALVDLEDGAGDCAVTGDAATRPVVSGTVAPGAYTGLAFKVGVPFDQNHLNAAAATAPLDRTALFWSWTSGYKYARIDGRNTSAAAPRTINVHLGATGCTPVDPADPAKGVTGCSAANVVDVSLPFAPGRNRVVLDVAHLLSGLDLDTDGGGPPGCMSGPTDPECGPIFSKLGLAWGGSAAGAQTLCSVE